MAFQFIHLEGYARKEDTKGRSSAFIFAEASRKPSASGHVEHPRPPIISYGISLEALEALHHAACEEARVSAGAKVRKIRSDQKTLHTVVASHPLTMHEIRADPLKRNEAERWEHLTIEWLKAVYGDDLKSVIRHEDESHFHIHAYVVPVSDPEMKAIKLHPGVMAKRAVMADGPRHGEDSKAHSRRADEAYKQSMRDLQDHYFLNVAARCGLTRLGPKKRRLTRAEWHAEKTQAQALKNALHRAERVKMCGDAFIANVNTRVRHISASADEKMKKAHDMARVSSELLYEAHAQKNAAAKMLQKARTYKGVAGALRAAWDGLQESRIYKDVERKLQNSIQQLQALALSLQSRIEVEQAKRREAEERAEAAEKRAQAASDEAVRVRFERDRALSMIPRRNFGPSNERRKSVKPDFHL